MAGKRTSIFLVGAVYIDTILTVPHYPAEDEKLRATSFSRRRGGNVANTAAVLAQLLDRSGPALTLVAPLPDETSAAFAFVQDSLGPQVRTLTALCRAGVTEAASSYVVRSAATGSRTIVNFNGLVEMGFEEFVGVVRAVGEAEMEGSWWHFEGRIPDITLQCLRFLRAHQPSTRISVEVEKPGRYGLQELAAEADVVFYSKNWALSEGFDGPELFLRAQAKITPRASLLCCTWGRSGAGALKIAAGETSYQSHPAFDCIQTVDSVGAGDTFIAGMLYGLTERWHDWGFQHSLAFAIKLAGEKVGQEGFDGLRDKVERHLAPEAPLD